MSRPLGLRNFRHAIGPALGHPEGGGGVDHLDPLGLDHADGGKLMTKPYASGGAYLNKMTDHCKGCFYDPKKRTGDDACPFTTLYWDFLDRHKEAFAKNHRMSQQVFGLKRLSDLPELRERAHEVLSGLEKGLI